MNGEKMTEFQASLALEEIARTARALSCIGSALESEGGELAGGLGIAVRCLAQRAGWIADMVHEQALGRSSGAETLSPIQWTMPPVYFSAGRD